MIGALLKVMTLGLIRDRGALVMAFVLPPLIFIIFAAIFSGTSGNEMRLKVAVLDAVDSPRSRALTSAIDAEPALRMVRSTADVEGVRAAVLSGDADVGLVISGSLADSSDEAPVLVIADAGRAMAGPIVSGHVQRLVARDLPDVSMRRIAPVFDTMTGGLTLEQRASLDAGMEALSAEAEDRQDERPLVVVETLSGRGGSSNTISYYAGAVAVMFLLFSAMQGATTLIDERSSGIVDRLAIGPAGTDVVVVSKFLFLTIQGALQVAVIFLVAWIAHGVNVPAHWLAWLITTMVASAAAAGLALVMASACTTRQQANTVSGFLVLIASAVGGSMVPRFMMPPWLQDLGWFTPNAWAIEAYHGALWRGETLWMLLPTFVPLLLAALIGLAAALALSRHRLRLE